MIGSAISSSILLTESTSNALFLEDNEDNNLYDHCGSRDCQRENITNADTTKPDILVVYIKFTCMSFIK